MSGAGERSIAEILTDIGRNAQEIVRAEIRLAKCEARAKIRTAGQGAIVLAAGDCSCYPRGATPRGHRTHANAHANGPRVADPLRGGPRHDFECCVTHAT